MIILVVGILLFLYGYLAKNKYSVYIGMLFVLLIMGFQEGVLGDFMEYKDSFNLREGESYSVKATEYSYLWANRFFQVTSFPIYVFCLSLVQCLILAYTLKSYVTPRFLNFGWLVFFFTTGCMLIQMKAMRQGYAVEWMLLSFVLLDKRKWFVSLVALLIGWGFHNTSVIFLPLYLILLFTKLRQSSKQNRVVKKSITRSAFFPWLVSIGCIVFYALKKLILDAYLIPYAIVLSGQYEGYVDQIENSGVSWWILVFFCTFTFFIANMIKSETNATKRIIGLASILSIYGLIAVWGAGNIMRACYYFTIFDIITYPLVADFISNKYGRKYAGYFMIFYMLYALKFSLPWIINSQGDMFSTYKFVFMP